MSLYRTSVLRCFENRSSYRYVLSIDVNRIFPVFSAVFNRFGNKKKFGMESSHKRPIRGGEFRDIWRNSKRTEFPHLLPTCVKFSVMTVQ